MGLLERIGRLRRGPDTERRFGSDEWPGAFSFDGFSYPITGAAPPSNIESVGNSFTSYVQSAYKSDGIVFACVLARLMIFSEARFQFQRMTNGRPGDLFGSQELAVLEDPWPNGSTGELLARMIQDADHAGQFYAVREGPRLRRLRPDWTSIILTANPNEATESDVAGYSYKPGGPNSGVEPVIYKTDQVVHWSPIPDPEAQYRGMSWLTPILREVSADKHATDHKLKFFTNGATLSSVISLKDTVTEEQFKKFVRLFNENHQGTGNAYKNLVVGGGADVTVVGQDMRQLDFRATQGAGETRIASAAGMHPVIVGLSEGLAGASLNAGNFASARRLTADKTMRPLWRSAAAALASVIKMPLGARLTYDVRDVAFLREDVKDLAEIQGREAQTIRTLLDAGYEGESVKAAVIAQDWSLLRHSGLYSVQLQPPITAAQLQAAEGDA